MTEEPKATILVVDDTEAGRYVTCKVLTQAGYEVKQAATGMEGLRIVKEGGIDLVVLDVKLPDIDGFEVCRRIKSDPATKSIPVLQTSATYLDAESQAHGLEVGADAYLTHPIEPVVLVATVKALLRIHKAEIENMALAQRIAVLYNQAERERKELETILDTVPSGVIIAEGPECKVISVNQRALELLGRPSKLEISIAEYARMMKLLRPNGSPYPPEQLPISRAASNGEKIQGDEMVIEHSDGRRITVMANAAPLYDEKGEIIGAIGVLEDITTLKNAEKSLKEAYSKEHWISVTLQKSLLPRVPGKIGRIQIADTYIPAYKDTLIGGDFFDMFMISSDLVGITIGDVSGKGIQSAVTTALAKYTLRAYAYEDPDPAVVLKRLNNALICETEFDSCISWLKSGRYRGGSCPALE